MNSIRRVGTLAAVFGVFFLSACGGGGGGSPSMGGDDEFARQRSDPSIVRLGGILERADTLLIPSRHVRFSATVQGQTVSERFVESLSCTGSRCTGNDGSMITVADLVDPSTDIGVTVTGAGMGSATWSGIAEAASTSTFQRREGTATLTIKDLSQPRVGVDIDINGFTINSPGWADIPLTNGRFATGRVESDRMKGQFYGPSHAEAYGVFDTGAYVGGFGVKRSQ